MFAVATDTNDVLVIDIKKILEGTEEGSFKESDISGKILKSQMLDKVRLFLLIGTSKDHFPIKFDVGHVVSLMRMIF